MAEMKSETAKREEEILAFWKDNNIFELSLTKDAPKGEFIFYDGPPFANGLPHMGHVLGSTVKDLVGRYKTMQGYRVPRKWGWDCHGLPVESYVEKKLGLKTKKDILQVGIDVFNEEARASVMQFTNEWEQYVNRIGRWVDFQNSYKTMDNSYIESVWWALKRLNEKGLLYEGKKVLMYCPHCETPLAKAEIAMDNTYKDVTEEAVTVKFKVKNPARHKLPENTFILAWTTTPWTLPGNVALAVGADIDYVLVQKLGEHFLLAKTLVDEDLAPMHEMKGSDLVGVEYEPLFDVPAIASTKNKKYVVVAGDFVSTTDGTGVVHTAVMYGEDDFNLGQQEGLPMVQLLNANGTYNDLAPQLVRGEYLKKGDKIIKEDLAQRGLLYKKEAHTHSYPHCYRCGTALIYNAVASWFINIQKVKAKMLSENEKINWVPAHLKHGRFKNNLENAPDWTISRNRFWASPLPIWKSKEGNNLMVVGSMEELSEKTKKSGNNYFVMRHGGARSNVEKTLDAGSWKENHLTEEGKATVHASAEAFAKENKIDLIITSPVLRAYETAEIARAKLGLPMSAVIVDERLRETGFGVYDRKPLVEWALQFASLSDRFTKAPEGGETYTQIRARMGECLFELEEKYKGKNILIISHGAPLWLLSKLVARVPCDECVSHDELILDNAQISKLPFVPFPHNKNFELDLHRPYIDAITLVDEEGKDYDRVVEVIDCWVESGAMPFASANYPHDKSIVDPQRFFGLAPKRFPGDFIAEYIAQTRTWFYYMHTLGVLLFNQLAFKNVVSTGTILAADGSKMSKSKGNYTDPLFLINQFGADAMRFHLMGSVVMQAEDLNFRDEDVRETHNRVIGILWNCFKFFELYKNEYDGVTKAQESTHVLDRWVLSLLGKTILEVTTALDAYDMPTACRALRAFVDDYSTWYVRRSRDRVKGDSATDKQCALATQREVLLTVAKLIAPIMPFLAESVYRGIEEHGSVHLTRWPEALPVREELLVNMAFVRSFATIALKQRDEAGIKVRQPLQSFTVIHDGSELPIEYQDVLKDEINVKEIYFKKGGHQEGPAYEIEGILDTVITPQLQEQGTVRGILRRIQEWRKEQGLSIGDRPTFNLADLGLSEEEKNTAIRYRTEIIKETGLQDLLM